MKKKKPKTYNENVENTQNRLTLSGKISATITYGTGSAPQDAMNIIAEKETTGTH